MDMKRSPNTAAFAGTAFCAAAVLAAVALSIFGTDTTGLDRSLQASALLAFILFWPAYAGSALKTLFGPAFEPISWRGRDFSLGFASAQLVSVALFVWLWRVSSQTPFAHPRFVFFAIGLVWTYVIATISFRGPAHAIGQGCYRVLRGFGMELISFAFLLSFVSHPLHGNLRSMVLYVPLVTVSVAGTLLRFGAWASRGAAMTKSA
jgi:hypothetical protein